MLHGEIDQDNCPPDATEDAKEKLAKRQANAAVALLRLNQPSKVWPLLKHSPDPTARSYLIHRLARWVPMPEPLSSAWTKNRT